MSISISINSNSNSNSNTPNSRAMAMFNRQFVNDEPTETTLVTTGSDETTETNVLAVLGHNDATVNER
jgi:hypothetical protein